ncbi:MAG: hypothetical protein N3B13_07080 [Deltaproteobacteria bacterium]|nr:hypothetical protein [Deltaproteobacteria bacterium]
MPSSEIPVLLSVCYDIEMKMYELYKILADKFSDNEKIKSLFLKTANEEINHANQFRFAMNITYKSRMEFETDISEIKKKVEKIDETILFARTMEYDLKNILELCIQLEEEFAEYHASRIIKFPNEKSLEQLFYAMMKADKGHVEELRQALKEIN